MVDNVMLRHVLHLALGISLSVMLLATSAAFAAVKANIEEQSVQTSANDQSDQFSASQSIERFHSSLILVMQEPDRGLREKLLRPRIIDLFDITRIASISLGRTWRTMSVDEKSAFKLLLTDLIVATYADRFDSYDNQRFVLLDEREAQKGVVVQSEIVRSNGNAVSLDYFFRDQRVFNVVADGVSDLSLRRADYNSILKNEGYAALVGHIEQKILQARAGT